MQNNSQSVSIDQFQKLDIRIGTITNAENLENSKKLVKLTVNFGDQTRTILATIGKVVENIDTLKGQQAPFVVNLEPKVLAGLTSEGMILAATKDDQPVLLAPLSEVEPGSRVR